MSKKGTTFTRGPMPQWHKDKIRDALKGKMPKFIPNTKGVVRSEEYKIKMSETLKKKGIRPTVIYSGVPWNKGKKGTFAHSEEFCRKQREIHRGEKSYRWISDRNLLKKENRHGDSAYREWRTAVYKRDGFKCKISDGTCTGKIEAHHILRWSDFPELRYQVNNGITLCHAHHPRQRAEEKRLIPVFLGLATVSGDIL